MDSEPTSYTAASLAALVGVDKSYVAGLCRAGKIAGAVKVADRVWIIPRPSADAWLERHKRTTRKKVP